MQTQVWKELMLMMNNTVSSGHHDVGVRGDDVEESSSKTILTKFLLLGPIDFIMKVDTDTMLFPNIYLWMNYYQKC